MSDDSDERRVSVSLDQEERRLIRIGMALTDTRSAGEFMKQAGIEKTERLLAEELARKTSDKQQEEG